MFIRASTGLLFLLLVTHGCSGPAPSGSQRLQHRAAGNSPEVLALYEAWFGHPKHISVGYSSNDPAEIKEQIRHAKEMGISAFVVDWYGDREPFIDRSYALMQTIADEKNFHVSMMYDESEPENGDATDDTLAAFDKFGATYLSSNAPGRKAYLTYNDRPVIFIFPKGGHTNWNRVRASTDNWAHPPLLIYE